MRVVVLLVVIALETGEKQSQCLLQPTKVTVVPIVVFGVIVINETILFDITTIFLTIRF